MKTTSRRVLSALALALTFSLAALGGCSGAGDRQTNASQAGFQAATFSQPGEHKAVEIFYGGPERLTQLVEAGMDVWYIDVQHHRAKGTLTLAQAQLAEKLGTQVRFLPQEALQLRVDTGYSSYEQILARLQKLAAQAPDYVQLVNLGPSWETSKGQAKRYIWALRLGKGTAKPIVTFAAGTHAREIVTPEVVLREAEALVNNYGKDPNTTSAIDNHEIWLVPLINPDGYAHALTGDLWRKNTDNVIGGKQRPGVDLNRNYGTAWGLNGDSGDPNSDVFRGSGPFSEPETQAMRQFLSQHPPSIYLTFHSYSNSVMWPWDHTTQPPPDPRLAVLGTALGKLSGYQAYQGCAMYLNGGDDVEWAFATLKSLAFTVEIGSESDGFMPPFSRMAQFTKENEAMMNYALQVAGNPAQLLQAR